MRAYQGAPTILAAVRFSSEMNVLANRGQEVVREFCLKFMKTQIRSGSNSSHLSKTHIYTNLGLNNSIIRISKGIICNHKVDFQTLLPLRGQRTKMS